MGFTCRHSQGHHFGLTKDPARCNCNDLVDAGVQEGGDLQVPSLLGKQLILFQGILYEPVTLENLDGASSDDFDPDSVLWIKPMLLLGNFLPVARAIAKLHVSGKLITMAAKLFASDSQESSAANDCVMLLGHAAFVSLHPDLDCYLSSALVFAEGDSHLHGFGFSALSSG